MALAIAAATGERTLACSVSFFAPSPSPKSLTNAPTALADTDVNTRDAHCGPLTRSLSWLPPRLSHVA